LPLLTAAERGEPREGSVAAGGREGRDGEWREREGDAHRGDKTESEGGRENERPRRGSARSR